MLFYFVRHGQSEANVSRQFSNQDPTKHPLTALGREQARALSERLRDVPFAAMYSSPLLRAIQTAEILNAPHGLDIQITPALIEHDAGDLEGRADPEAWELYSALMRTWSAGDRDARIPGGESYNELEARFVPFIRGLIARYGGTDANVVCVAHGGTFHLMLPMLCRNLSFEFSYEHLLPNTGLILVELRGDDLVCLSWAGVEPEPAMEGAP